MSVCELLKGSCFFKPNCVVAARWRQGSLRWEPMNLVRLQGKCQQTDAAGRNPNSDKRDCSWLEVYSPGLNLSLVFLRWKVKIGFLQQVSIRNLTNKDLPPKVPNRNYTKKTFRQTGNGKSNCNCMGTHAE
eukprot:3878915-Amphidinium_carterae.1